MLCSHTEARQEPLTNAQLNESLYRYVDVGGTAGAMLEGLRGQIP